MTYFSTFVPGLQDSVQAEIETKIKGAQINSLLNGLVVFETQNQKEKIKNLCLTEDNFILIRKFAGLPQNPFRLITRILKKEKVPTATLPTLQNFKILVHVSGKFPFTRRSLAQELEKILSEKLNLSSSPDSKNEFWFFLRGRLGLLGFKITDEKIKYRDYKIKNIPGSLKPQVAHALCLLSEPNKKDVFLDPMCGVGTILIERAHYFPFKRILGRDINQDIINLAVANIKKAKAKIEIKPGNATRLSAIPANSIDKLVTNPPWGRTHSPGLDYRAFYPKLLREFHRLLKPNGVLVLLTSEKALMEKLIKDNQNRWRQEQQLNIFVSGQKAGIYKLRRI